MADDKPKLRVVAPDEVASPAATERRAPPPPPEPEGAPLVERVKSIDARRPLLAGYLVCVGCRLADSAVDFYHQAAQHAPAGTFRNDVPPGLRSAEATRAWLGSHLDDLKKLSEDEGPKPPYTRAADLRAAVALAVSELDRAMVSTSEAGLWFDERRGALFRDADEDIDAGVAYAESVASAAASATAGSSLIHEQPESGPSLYVLGLDALSGAHVAHI